MGTQSILVNTDLLRAPYKLLLGGGRAYAAFSEQDVELVELFESPTRLLDPMSGYGSVTGLAARFGLGSFCLELNGPQYLWQQLTHPTLRREMLEAVSSLRQRPIPAAKSVSSAVLSDDWFPEACWNQVMSLRLHVLDTLATTGLSEERQADALLLPFVGRLACCRPGHSHAHVRRGGICVLRDWDVDFRKYLQAVESLLSRLPASAGEDTLTAFGDARSYEFEQGGYDALLTAPPYPNRFDYADMFRPENEYLNRLGAPEAAANHSGLIGSIRVSASTEVDCVSPLVADFLEAIAESAGVQHAKTNHEVYYRRYFLNYFRDLKEAYTNAAGALGPRAEGFIVVVDNTHRRQTVPLSEFTIETWRSLGYDTTVMASNQVFRLGTANPRARGLSAQHVKHVVRIRRGTL